MDTLESLQAAEDELIRLDPALGALISSQRIELPQARENYFIALCRSIIGQQVSVAAGNAIFARLQAATALDPRAVIELPDDAVKEIGLSRQKAGYIRDLAQHFAENGAVFAHLEELPDEQVIAELTRVKGIGVWTAQMFLMFTLRRPDVFAPDDVGLQRGMIKLYGWDVLPPRGELQRVAEKWRPWRTVACLHLWESLRNNPDNTW